MAKIREDVKEFATYNGTEVVKATEVMDEKFYWCADGRVFFEGPWNDLMFVDPAMLRYRKYHYMDAVRDLDDLISHFNPRL